MQDILLDSTGDIAISKGDIIIADSLRQSVMIRLRWFLNEWQFNPDFGIPYYDEIFGKSIDIKRIETIIEEALLGVDGIQSVSSVTAKYDRATRALSVQFTAKGDETILREEVTINV